LPAVRVLLGGHAERELGRLPRDVQRRFARALEELARDSRPRPGLDVKPLRGLKGFWRLRVGDYRGVFQLEEGVARFTRFGHRSKIHDV